MIDKFIATQMAIQCYGYDARRAIAHMHWRRGRKDYWKLSAELFFQYHKIEKGLSIGGSKRFFGEAPARRTCELMQEWVAAGFSLSDPVYAGSVETMRSYRDRLKVTPPADAKVRADLERRIDAAIGESAAREDLATPFAFRPSDPAMAEMLETLCHQRRSVRDFDGAPVDLALVKRALQMAQLSPSACNRQPCRVHLFPRSETMEKMLALQNGNSGFGHTIPLLAVITSDSHGFFDTTERNEPFLDGGLFLMSFLLGLQSLGLSTCCLNWCVMPKRDVKAHQIGGIPDNEIILTFLAIGHARAQAVVPRSARRSVDDVMVIHQ